jgi:tetratricopeptide (TPR) repeat protein
MQSGQFDKATAEVMQALDLDPFAPHLYASAGHVFFDAQQYDRAIKAWQRALELDPTLIWWRKGIASAYAHRRMYDDAVREELDFWQQEYEYKQLLHWDQSPQISALLRKAYAVSGYPGYLRAKLSSKYQQVMDCGFYERAVIYAQLGENDNAFDALAKAIELKDDNLGELPVDPDLENLHSDPRFQELLLQCRAGGWAPLKCLQ